MYVLKYEEQLLSYMEQQQITASNGLAVFNPTHSDLSVAVHNGAFHADEVLAMVLLQVFAGIDPRVQRTRDQEVLRHADLRLDVGEGLLDHHGRDLAVPGVAACTKVFALLKQSKCFAKMAKRTANQLEELVDQVAASDTGIGDPNWITQLVQTENRLVLVKTCAGDASAQEAGFSSALKQVKHHVESLVEIWEAEALAEAAAWSAIKQAEEHNSKVVVLPKEARLADVKRLIWKNWAWTKQVLYYVSPESDKDWRVLCCAELEDEYSPFSSRKLLPEACWGLRGEEFDKASGRKGGIFCHAAGFIAGFTTASEAIAFAEAAAAL